MASLPNENNFKLYADNFFSSLQLIQEEKNPRFCMLALLITEGHYAIGYNEKVFCHCQKRSEKGVFTIIPLWSMNIVAIRWFDNNVVNLVSWYAGVEPVWTVSRYAKVEWKMAKMFKLQNRILFCQL